MLSLLPRRSSPLHASIRSCSTTRNTSPDTENPPKNPPHSTYINLSFTRTHNKLDGKKKLTSQEAARLQALFTAQINRFQRQQDAHGLHGVLDKMNSVGYVPGATPLTRLIAAMHSLNDRKGISNLLQQLLLTNARLDLVVINAFISHFSGIGDKETVQQLLQKIAQLKLKPDLYTFTALMKDSMNRGDTQGCLHILGLMRTNNVEPTTVAYNHVLTSMTKTNNRQAIEKMCKEMENKHVVFNIETYHILLELYARATDWHLVSKTMQLMEEHGIMATVRTYNILLRAARQNGDWNRFENLWNKVEELGPTEVSYAIKAEMPTTRIKHSEGQFDQLLQKMSNDDITAGATFFNSVMHHTAQAGLPEECEKLYEQMKAKKLLPNTKTFRYMIDAWFSKDMKDKALAVFAEMKTSHKQLIDRSIYDTLFQNLWRLGLENDVIAVISDMRSRGLFVGPDGAGVLLVFHAKRKNWKKWKAIYEMAKEKNVLTSGVHQMVKSYINEDTNKKFEADLKALAEMNSKAGVWSPISLM